jgi:GrpB-like predicted nucleotidyltransferase (UPF0157 family)
MRRIIIVDYNPQWTTLFEEERVRLMQVIGEYVVAVEHVGSTAVTGLGAKPCIDIMIGVESLGDADALCMEPILKLGYIYQPDYEDAMPFRRYFYKNAPPAHSYHHSHHLHLVETTQPFWEDHLLFRDYLQSHSGIAEAYEDLKRELAPQFTRGNDYAEAKTEFIEATLAKARQWATKTSGAK